MSRAPFGSDSKGNKGRLVPREKILALWADRLGPVLILVKLGKPS